MLIQCNRDDMKSRDYTYHIPPVNTLIIPETWPYGMLLLCNPSAVLTMQNHMFIVAHQACGRQKPKDTCLE